MEGLLGHFSPALPLHRHEIEQRLGWFDYGRLCEPYIRWHMLQHIFQGEAQAVFDEYMDDAGYGAIRLKEHVRHPAQDRSVYSTRRSPPHPQHAEHLRWLRTGLFQLGKRGAVRARRAARLLPSAHHAVTRATRSGSWTSKTAAASYDEIYIDFFFRRHEEFWRQQGLVKLPPVRYATDMLICGEDLGMVPASVPGVMQRAGHAGPEHPAHALRPRNRVWPPRPCALPLAWCSPGSHDMSTVRGWWEEDRVRTQRFFETICSATGAKWPRSTASPG